MCRTCKTHGSFTEIRARSWSESVKNPGLLEDWGVDWINRLGGLFRENCNGVSSIHRSVSTVGKATGYGLGGRGVGFESR
jgi:hypothetical protein